MATDVNGVSGAIGQPGRLVTTREGTASPANAGSARGAPGPSDDVVALHYVSRARELAESVRGLPVVDARRVQTVRNALASGHYQVDPARVADRLVAFESQIDACRC